MMGPFMAFLAESNSTCQFSSNKFTIEVSVFTHGYY